MNIRNQDIYESLMTVTCKYEKWGTFDWIRKILFKRLIKRLKKLKNNNKLNIIKNSNKKKIKKKNI